MSVKRGQGVLSDWEGAPRRKGKPRDSKPKGCPGNDGQEHVYVTEVRKIHSHADPLKPCSDPRAGCYNVKHPATLCAGCGKREGRKARRKAIRAGLAGLR